MVKWSELPPEILYSISLRIDNPFDLIHFRSVCSFWRSSSLLKFRPKTPLRCPLPLDSGGCGDDCHILNSRVYLLKSSDHNGPRYWLFKLREKEEGDIVLHSLFIRRNSSEYGCLYPIISLDLLKCHVFELAQERVACYSEWSEPFECEGEVEGRIGFMSLDAENNEFMVLGHLTFTAPAVYRSIDERWTELMIPQPNSFLEGIVSYKSKFYAIDCTGITIVVEPTLQVTTFQRSRPCDNTRKRWLLKSGDKVLLVEMCTENFSNFSIPDIREKKIWFEVSELDVERNDWNQVEDVDGRVLFLEDYCSFSCLATEIQGFKANSIIFLNLWGGNLYDHESVLVYEFDEQGVRTLEDIPGYVELFPSPPGWGPPNQCIKFGVLNPAVVKTRPDSIVIFFYFIRSVFSVQLLNSGDKVLLVEMCTESRSDFIIPYIPEKKIWFEVSELDEERCDWNQMEDVDDRVLFLERFCSFSCLATEIQGFRANSIIFLDLWGGTNTGEHESILAYEFDEHGVRSLEDFPEYVELFPSPPGWVISNA